MSDRALSFILLALIAVSAFSLVRSVTTGRVSFVIGTAWSLKADRTVDAPRYWGFVAANAGFLILLIFIFGKPALTWAGLQTT
jgi:hypothetical protein